MTNPTSTAVLLLVDAGAPTKSVREAVAKRLTEAARDQAGGEGAVTFEVATYGAAPTRVARSAHPSDVTVPAEPSTEAPALRDSLVAAVRDFGAAIGGLADDERPGRVLVLVAATTADDASTDASVGDARSVIEHQAWHYSWDFAYVGTKHDAVARAEELGVYRGHALEFGTGASALKSLRAAVADLFAATRERREFTFDDHRAQAVAAAAPRTKKKTLAAAEPAPETPVTEEAPVVDITESAPSAEDAVVGEPAAEDTAAESSEATSVEESPAPAKKAVRKPAKKTAKKDAAAPAATGA